MAVIDESAADYGLPRDQSGSKRRSDAQAITGWSALNAKFHLGDRSGGGWLKLALSANGPTALILWQNSRRTRIRLAITGGAEDSGVDIIPPLATGSEMEITARQRN